MTPIRKLFPALILPFAIACGDSGESTDTGSGNPDAGPTDTGGVDTGVGNDAGPGDTGPEDTGVNASCPAIGTPVIAGTAPERRGDMASAYDPECRRVYMFSGDKAEPVMCGPAGSQFVNDFHVFDIERNQWFQLAPGGGDFPLPRARSQGSWDAMRKRFIVFGGRWRQGGSGAYSFMNDVWAYDPATNMWTELAGYVQNPGGSGPRGRMNFGMVADAPNDRILIVEGGQVDASFTAYTLQGDTWAFNLSNNTWERIAQASAAQPTPRLFHVTALDTTRNHLYILGGGGADAFTSPQFFRDLWRLDLATGQWTEVQQDPLNRPTGRIKGEMRYDVARDLLVLYGGHDDTSLGNNSEIWTFNPMTDNWAQRSVGDAYNPNPSRPPQFCDFPSDFVIFDFDTPERRESHLFAIGVDEVVMFGGRTDCGLSNDTWILNLIDYTWTEVNSSFNGMACPRQGRQDCANASYCG